MAPSGAPQEGLALRLARWVGSASVPLAIPANVGAYLLGLWLVEGASMTHAAQTQPWRLVAVIVLVTAQAFWLRWVRQQALGTFTASVVLWLLAVLAGGYDPLAVQPGLLLATFGYAAERPGHARAVVVGVAIMVTAGGLLVARALHRPDGAPEWHDPVELVACTLIAAFTVGLPALAGGWYAQLRDRAERISDLAMHATTGEASRTADAVAAERRALAQEIHDTSSAHLTAILALSAAVQSAPDESTAARRRIIEQIAAEGQALFQGYERMLNTLRQEDRTVTKSHALGHRPGQHSATELLALVEAHRGAAGMRIALSFEPELAEIDRRLGPMRSHTAYRVVQEALNNARKHAAGADVSITVEDDGESLLLRIENDAPVTDATFGTSVTPARVEDAAAQRGLSLGYGIDGLRDRLTAVGGSLRVGPTQRGGWSVNALLPHPPHQQQVAGRPAPPLRRASRQAGPPEPAAQPVAAAGVRMSEEAAEGVPS